MGALFFHSSSIKTHIYFVANFHILNNKGGKNMELIIKETEGYAKKNLVNRSQCLQLITICLLSAHQMVAKR